jgi:hypothetical protein
MANIAENGGFQPVASLSGGPGHTGRYSAPATYGTGIGKGDLTLITGAVNVDTTYGGPHSLAEVNQAAATDVTNGAAMNYRAASVLGSVFVEEDPSTIYLATVNGAANAIAVADSQLNTNWVVGTASTVTGLSLYTLNGAAENTTNTLGVRLLRPYPFIGEDDTLATPRWMCLINRHRYVNQIAGV